MNIENLDLFNDFIDGQYLLVDGPGGPNRLDVSVIKSLLEAVQVVSGNLSVDGTINAERFENDSSSTTFKKTQESDFQNIQPNASYTDGALRNNVANGVNVALSSGGADATSSTIWTVPNNSLDDFLTGSPAAKSKLVAADYATAIFQVDFNSEEDISNIEYSLDNYEGRYDQISSADIYVSSDGFSSQTHLGTLSAVDLGLEPQVSGLDLYRRYGIQLGGIYSASSVRMVISTVSNGVSSSGQINMGEFRVYNSIAESDNNDATLDFQEASNYALARFKAYDSDGEEITGTGKVEVSYSTNDEDSYSDFEDMEDFKSRGNLLGLDSIQIKVRAVGLVDIAEVWISSPNSSAYWEPGVFIIEINGVEMMRIEGGNLHVGGILTLTERTPESSTADGEEGTVATDDDYIYVCTGTNTWKRAAISAW